VASADIMKCAAKRRSGIRAVALDFFDWRDVIMRCNFACSEGGESASILKSFTDGSVWDKY
jgi:hypothetical protein